METVGKITQIQMEYGTNTPVVSIALFGGSAVNEAAELKGEKVSIKIQKWRPKRSLDANSFFHVMVDKLRQSLKISFAACKNQLITSYGQVEYIDGEQVVIKTNIKPDVFAENETLHCKPVKVEVQKDREVWFYRVYRGSHTYDSREMALLIDGTVEECKAQGIETMTPDQIKELESKWHARS